MSERERKRGRERQRERGIQEIETETAKVINKRIIER